MSFCPSPVPVAPQTLTIIISNVCQQRCRFCGVNHDAVVPTFLSLETIKNMHWLQHVKSICVSGSGEALTHPHYCDIISTFRKIAPQASIMLYTNGLSLHGKKLDATLDSCNEIHISQNAIDRRTYEAIIHQGNFEHAMMNLKELAEKRPPHVRVKLSLVFLRETLPSIPKFIGLARTYGFHEIILKPGRVPFRHYSYEMPSSSYEVDLEKDVNLNEMYQLSKGANVALSFPIKENLDSYICYSPFTNMLINIDYRGKIRINYCCKGNTEILSSEHALCDIDKIWNNGRINLIRNTVNDLQGWYKNKMCMACRCIDEYWDYSQRNDALTAFNIKANDQRPEYFDELYLS